MMMFYSTPPMLVSYWMYPCRMNNGVALCHQFPGCSVNRQRRLKDGKADYKYSLCKAKPVFSTAIVQHSLEAAKKL